MATCPRCKNDMPLLSKICPVCGYVPEDQTAVSAAQQINMLEQLIFKLKQIPLPTFLSSLKNTLGIIIFIAAVYSLTMAYITNSAIFKIIGGLFLIVLPYFVGRFVISWFKPTDKKAVDSLKNEYEYLERNIRREFGKSGEVSRQIDALNSEMVEAVGEWERSRKGVRNIWAGICIGIVALASGSITMAHISAAREAATAAYGTFQRAVNEFVASPDNSDFIGEQTRLTLIREMIAEEHVDFARKFFAAYCQKRIGDLECAQAIVQKYLSDGNAAAAAEFVESAQMRYPSDKTKLTNMLK